MSFLSNLLPNIEGILFSLLILLLPTQLGKHFWPDFSIVSGIRVDYLSPTLYGTDIIIFFLFVLWFFQKIQRSKFKTQRYKSEVNIFAGVLLFLLFNIFVSQNIWNGLYHMLKFLEFSFFTYYVASLIKTIVQIKKIFFLLGVGIVGQSLLAIAQFLKQGSLGGAFYLLGERTFTAATPGIANASINGELILRPYGTFSHPNVMAGFLLISMICLLFSLSWARTRAEKGLWAIFLLFGSSALLLSMSRLAVTLWVVLLTVVFVQQIKKGYSRLFAALVLGGCFCFVLFVTPFGSRLLQTSFTEEAVVQRTELIRTSSALFLQQPVIGVGLGQFIPMLATVQKPLSFGLYHQPVHNIFLLVLVETGIIGLGFFIWFLVKTYKELFGKLEIKSERLPYRIFMIALSGILILGLFDHYPLTLQQGQLFFSLILGLSWTKLRG